MKASKLYMLLMVSIVFYSCGNDPKEDKEPLNVETSNRKEKENLNISFLLDLSDRISPQKYANESMEFYQRDVAYIRSVSEAFVSHLKGKKVRGMNDKIQLYFDPEPLNQSINKISNDLRYHVNRSNASLEILDEIEHMYSEKPLEIYEYAIKDAKYVGSDTWRFFKTKISDYCIEDDYRNILVVLTDGYIYHMDTKIMEGNRSSYLTPQLVKELKLNDKDWKGKIENKEFGFISTGMDLSNLEVLVLGINPSKNNPYEEDVIMKYWRDWLEDMKVKRYEIKTAELPSNMDKIIKEFILN